MVDVPIKQAKPVVLRPPRVDTIVTLNPNTTTSSPTQPPPTQLKRTKIKRILKKSHNPESQADDTSLENREKATKQSMAKHSSTKFNKETLAIYDQMDKLYKMMREFKVYNIHPSHKALFNAFEVSLSVDEDDMDKLADPPL
nr:hypothetical protein [Tanacetum cinerariifolium]